MTGGTNTRNSHVPVNKLATLILVRKVDRSIVAV